MADYARVLLSGSTNGKPVKVAATATAGTLIHTATALTGTAGYDEIYAWVTNTSAGDVSVTVEYGGATDPDCLVCKAVVIPANSGPTPLLPGLVLQNGLTVKAFASVANVLLLTGFVNRIS